MDISTIFGLIVSLTFVVWCILLGGSLMIFVDIPSVVLVCGGTFAVLFIKFSARIILTTINVVKNAFFTKPMNPQKIIEEFVSLSKVARKEGLLALERKQFNDPFMKKGIQFCIDGSEGDFIKRILSTDLANIQDRHVQGQRLLKAIGESAPSFGMIGTLIGLVQMLVNMEDPSQIGPGMATAILTTLYGALIANVIALPINDKLTLRNQEETLTKSMIIEGILGVARGENPRMLEEILKTFLPGKKRVATQQK